MYINLFEKKSIIFFKYVIKLVKRYNFNYPNFIFMTKYKRL